MAKIKEFITECRRVLRVARKPSKQEFWTVAKVSGIGILIIGLLGFLLHLIDSLTSVIVVSLVVGVLVVLVLFIIEKKQ